MVSKLRYEKMSPTGRSKSVVPPRMGRLQLAYLRQVWQMRDFIDRPSSILSKKIRFAPVHEPIRPVSELFRMRSGPDVVFRTFSDSDAPELSRIVLENKRSVREKLTTGRWESIQRYDSPEAFMMRARRDTFFVAAEAESGRVAGAISYHRYSKTSAEPSNFSVGEDFRSLGLGKLLAAKSLLAMMSEGVEGFRVFVAPMSQGIFDELGFVEGSRIARLISGGTILSLKSDGDEGLRFLCHSMLERISAA